MTDSDTQAETVDAGAEEAPSAPATPIDAAQPRDGNVLWFAHNGQEFAVREGTAEHELLERSLAKPLRGPSVSATPSVPRGNTTPAASRPRSHSRTTVETRAAKRR